MPKFGPMPTGRQLQREGLSAKPTNLSWRVAGNARQNWAYWSATKGTASLHIHAASGGIGVVVPAPGKACGEVEFIVSLLLCANRGGKQLHAPSDVCHAV